MAIYPDIALGVRSPQIDVPIPQPLQQFGQILTLRDMMQRGQLTQYQIQEAQLQLELARQAAAERGRVGQLFRNPQAGAAPGTPPLQTAPPAGTAAQIAPGAATPNLGMTAAPSAAGTLTNVPDWLAGISPPISGPNAPGAAPSAATLGVWAQPAPPAAAAQTAGPMAPAAAAPGSGVSPAPVALGAAKVEDPFANLPSFGQIIQAAPTTGFSNYIEPIAKAQKAYWENLDAAHKADQNRWDALGRIAAGVHDEKSKLAAIAQASREGLISDDVRDQLLRHPYIPDEWNRFQVQALEGQKRLQEVRDEINQKATEATAAFEAAKRPYQLEGERLKTEGEQFQTFAQGIGKVTSAPPEQQAAAWDRYKADAPPAVQKYFAGVPWGPQTEAIAVAKATKPEYGKTVPYPAPVEQQKIETVQATKLAELAAEMQAYQPVIQSVMSGKQRLQDLPQETQTKITPGLIMAGYTGFGKLISDPERERLGDYDRALTVLQNTLGTINGPIKNEKGEVIGKNAVDYMGPVEGLQAKLPYGTTHQILESQLITEQQQLKKFITNGSLRGLTQETLNSIFPTITTDPRTAKAQITQLQDLIQKEKLQYLKDLSDKVIPSSLQGGTALTPDQRAVLPTTAPPPGKMAGVKSDGKGGWKGVFFNSKDVDEARRQGVIVP